MLNGKTQIKRRDFAKIAGAAALAGPSLNVLGANDRVRVACVGYSDRFRGSLLPTFMAAQKELNFDLVAVADLWKKRLYGNAKPWAWESMCLRLTERLKCLPTKTTMPTW